MWLEHTVAKANQADDEERADSGACRIAHQSTITLKQRHDQHQYQCNHDEGDQARNKLPEIKANFPECPARGSHQQRQGNPGRNDLLFDQGETSSRHG
ncbi:hypothetical protein D3C79_903400 [compost metagenome]